MTGSAAEPGVRRGPATFLGILGISEFRWLWMAGAQSLLGDQLARVALALLVYDRTESDLATAAVYAWTFLPAVGGNLLFSRLLDRWPRRRGLVAVDLVRAVLLALMALPATPLPLLVVALTAVVVLGSPWSAIESALVADVLDHDVYHLGIGLRTATLQSSQLIGFAVGGVVVAVVGPHVALGVDAATFLFSAVILRLGLRARRAATVQAGRVDQSERSGGALDDAVAAAPAPRPLAVPGVPVLLGFMALLGLLVVPEGLAAPYTQHIGSAQDSVGWLLAAGPTGVLVGSLMFSRLLTERWRLRLVTPLALAAGLPLLACPFVDSWLGTAVLWAFSGAATAYQVQVVTEYAAVLPAARRAGGMGLASALLLVVQGIGLVSGGALAQWLDPASAVAIAGAAACVCAVLLGLCRQRRLGVEHGAHRSAVGVRAS